jgi:hypothetical protein
MDWRHGSTGKVSALQSQSQIQTPVTPKEKKEKKKKR